MHGSGHGEWSSPKGCPTARRFTPEPAILSVSPFRLQACEGAGHRLGSEPAPLVFRRDREADLRLSVVVRRKVDAEVSDQKSGLPQTDADDRISARAAPRRSRCTRAESLRRVLDENGLACPRRSPGPLRGTPAARRVLLGEGRGTVGLPGPGGLRSGLRPKAPDVIDIPAAVFKRTYGRLQRAGCPTPTGTCPASALGSSPIRPYPDRVDAHSAAWSRGSGSCRQPGGGFRARA